MKEINKQNFFLASVGVFTQCAHPTRSPDYISFFKGVPSSYYWFEESRLIRKSNHWFQVAQCNWELTGVDLIASNGQALNSAVNGVIVEVCASVKWSDLKWCPQENVNFSKLWKMLASSENSHLLREVMQQYS